MNAFHNFSHPFTCSCLLRDAFEGFSDTYLMGNLESGLDLLKCFSE